MIPHLLPPNHMNGRPTLNSHINITDFKQFYWSKIELMAFCHDNHLSTQGGKLELTARIETWLSTGERDAPIPKRVKKKPWDSVQPLERNTPVVRYKSDPATRAFFQQEIGPHFRFNADVLTWIKEKQTKDAPFTYGNIIEQWQKAEQLKNDPEYQRAIPKQFQFNQFMKDWKTANAGPGAQKAWQWIRSLPGEATYAHYIKMTREANQNEGLQR